MTNEGLVSSPPPFPTKPLPSGQHVWVRSTGHCLALFFGVYAIWRFHLEFSRTARNHEKGAGAHLCDLTISISYS